MGKEIDPADIGKYPEVIKKAQAEMSNIDVLVCGQCNNVFHFIENFREHKTIQCSKSLTLKDNLETKPVIWSFLLWKASQLNQDQSKESNSWRLYQNWMKLDEAIKETWVVAGRTIQSFAKIGQGSLQEMPVKITKTVVDNSAEASRGRQLVTNRVVNKTPMSQKELDASFNELKNSETSTPLGTKRAIVRSPPSKNILTRVGATIVQSKPGIMAREAWRTMGNSTNGNVQTKEHRIEKILAKRFNPRQKEHEYLIKWENVSHENNTWEPASHLEPCPVLLDTFEKQLARQKEQRQAQAAKLAQAQAQQQIQDESKANDSVSSQSEDDSLSGMKRRKLENSPIKGINKIDTNSFNRSIVGKTKPNGIQHISNDKSAEVVITNSKDGKQTGIVKKTGVSINPAPKNEAQVKVIPKGGDSVSGVVRVSSTQRIIQKLGSTTVKTVQNNLRPAIKTQQKATSVAIATPTRNQPMHSLSTVSQQTRSGVKPTITRVVKSTPTSKSTTPEQKIAALTRQEPTTKTETQEQQQQQMPIVATQILTSVDTPSASSVPLIDTSNLEQNINEIKKENEDIVMNEEQLQQLQQAGGIVTDQDGIQQILAASEDGSQQLIQFVTGEDGTIYQVAGKNEQGQTILIAQGADGDHVYVAAEDSEALGLDEGNNGVLSIDGNLVEANSEVQQQLQQQLVGDSGQQSIHFSIGTDEASAVQNVHQPLAVATEDGDSQDGQITAEVVQADLPSPGGTRRVVLQLPDGTFMVTEVDEEQFKALNMQG
ncbi:uncharacterized protein LOC116343478 isoform X2 [Contarinia nasturtii]|uniref:uncharacterized protein LOC116343478 isoform X2 n=1 Tax=Contarinia nasturtii TaxID=265458 RepID=UPI0012D3A0F7|nr:uncharacterized protein LOC116343478 isoform X2 [Contarinia nasturtii]